MFKLIVIYMLQLTPTLSVQQIEVTGPFNSKAGCELYGGSIMSAIKDGQYYVKNSGRWGCEKNQEKTK